MKISFFALSFFTLLSLKTFSQNVGIGVQFPSYKLDIAGTLHTSTHAFVGGFLGVNTTSPQYRLQVNDGAIAIFNTIDVKAWNFSYNSTNNYFQLAENIIPRLVVANGGNVGIGTTTPAAKLDVMGDAKVTGDLEVTGDITINNKGLLYNAASNAKLRYFTKTAAFTVTNLAPLGVSAETSITFTGFTAAPQVMVGNITAFSGTKGQAWKCQLVIYDVTASGCKCRISNTSNTTISQNITWNIICIGK